MADVLTVEPDEEVEQIQARLVRARSRHVYLYLPKPNATLRRRLSLALLRRTADSLGLNLTIVTRDSATRVMAGSVGLSVRWKIEGGEWKGENGRGRMEDGKQKGDFAVSDSTLHSPISILQSPFSIVAWAALLLVLGLTLVVLVLPHATIIVTPLTVPLGTTVEIQADPGLTAVDVPGRRIPASRLEVTLDRQAREPTLARKDVPDAQAQGTVVFVNQSETEVRIPAGAMVSTGGRSAVTFRTWETVTVPGPAGSRARVRVEAVEPGPEGNVPAYTIDVLDPSLGLPVAVVNDRPMSGGTVQRVGVVTQEERDRVRDALFERTRQEALQVLGAQVREGETLIDDSIEVQVVDESFSEQAGAVADVIAVDLTVWAVGTVINLDQARRLAEEVLRQQAPEGQAMVDGSLKTTVEPVWSVDGGVRVRTRAMATAQARIKEVDIKNTVRGRPVDEAVMLLRERFPLATAPTVEVSRGWLGRMPWLSMRIDVVVGP